MPKPLRCFISAPAQTDTSALRHVLTEEAVESYDAYDFNAGDHLYRTLKTRIKGADFAIIVIPEPSPNVFYEMGICEGMGKPLFVLVGKDIEAPYFVDKHTLVRAGLEDEGLLRISIHNFVAQVRSNKRKLRKSPPKRHSLGGQRSVRQYTDAAAALREQGTGSDLERLAEQVFAELGLLFQANMYKAESGVDFAIWDESLANSIGNPLLVEVKYGDLSPAAIYQAEQQLRRYLGGTEARAAILLYLDRQGRRFDENPSLDPLIVRFDFGDFIDAVSRQAFGHVILDKRNRMVHGVRR